VRHDGAEHQKKHPTFQSGALVKIDCYFDLLRDLRFQVVLGREAYDGIGDCTIFEYQDGRDGADFEFAGDFAVVVDVDLADFDCVAEFCCELFEDRSNCFTRTAPWCPEVYDDGDGCAYCSFEVAAIEFCDVFRHKFLNVVVS
jgi:hypothetical protein